MSEVHSKDVGDQEIMDKPRIYPMPPFIKKAGPQNGDTVWVVDLHREKAHTFRVELSNGEMPVMLGTYKTSVKAKDFRQTGANTWRVVL